MDERLEKAFAVANYRATLSNQRRIINEEFDHKLVYYINGGTFRIDPTLINYTKIMLELGHTHDVPFTDVNNFPIVIPDVKEFFDTIVKTYWTALNEYAIKFGELRSKRKVGEMVEL
jgi:hypothetical protein